MPHILVERTFAVPRTLQEMIDNAPDEGCFSLYMVNFRWSYLATDGSRAVCCFEAPDAESVRIPLRRLGVDVSVVWTSTLRDSPGLDRSAIVLANVLVERNFAEPVTLDSIQSTVTNSKSSSERHGVTHLRTLIARDGKRALCVYRGANIESVRSAQTDAQLPFTQVWAFDTIWPRNEFARPAAVTASS